MPPLVFVGRGRAYSIYAVKKRPSSAGVPLYHVPAPNVFAGGNICVGNTPFPDCSTQTIAGALTLFWEGSAFNSHLSQDKCRRYPGDVRRLWQDLEGKKRFPLSELVPMNKTLLQLI
jgi:PRTRC genetic system protein B